MFSSPRVWWTFRLFGAEKVFILEGGLPKWKAEGRPVETARSSARRARSRRAKPPAIVASLADRAGGLAEQDRTGGRCATRRPLPRRGAGAAPWRALGPHPGLAQRALHRVGRERMARSPEQLRRHLPQAASTSTGRSSPAAARACPPRRSGSRSTPWARSPRRSTTAPGRNGERATICRSDRRPDPGARQGRVASRRSGRVTARHCRDGRMSA